MIRPFTCLVFLLACGSGLYLYQSKHRVSLLDEQIAQTVKSSDALRAQTRMLSAEWTLLNDPERLRQLASQFLTLQTVSPNQFTSLADLDNRLPPPVPPGPPPETPNDVGGTVPSAQGPVPMASAGSGETEENEGRPADAKPMEAKIAEAPSPKAAMPPAPPASPPSARVAMTTPAEPPRPVERKPAAPRLASVTAPPRTVASQPRPPDQRSPMIRSAELRSAAPRLTEARSMVPAPRVSAPVPMSSGGAQAGGSMLGMAHGTGSPPLPRPMPMNAPQWSYSNGG